MNLDKIAGTIAGLKNKIGIHKNSGYRLDQVPEMEAKLAELEKTRDELQSRAEEEAAEIADYDLSELKWEDRREGRYTFQVASIPSDWNVEKCRQQGLQPKRTKSEGWHFQRCIEYHDPLSRGRDYLLRKNEDSSYVPAPPTPSTQETLVDDYEDDDYAEQNAILEIQELLNTAGITASFQEASDLFYADSAVQKRIVARLGGDIQLAEKLGIEETF